MSAHGPGCVKKASYRHREQNPAGIRALNAIFLESILRAAWGACWCPLNTPVPGGPENGFQENCVQDRKSTRLNSSHLGISYAVFCLKKKKISTDSSCRR